MKKRLLSILTALAVIVSLIPAVVFAAGVPEALQPYEGYWTGEDTDGNRARLNCTNYDDDYTCYDAVIRWDNGNSPLFISSTLKIESEQVVVNPYSCSDFDGHQQSEDYDDLPTFSSAVTSFDSSTGVWTLTFTGTDAESEPVEVTFNLEKEDVELDEAGTVTPQSFTALKQSSGAWEVTVDGTLVEGETWGYMAIPSVVSVGIIGFPMKLGFSVLSSTMVAETVPSYIGAPIALRDSDLNFEKGMTFLFGYGIKVGSWTDGNTITIDEGELGALFVYKMTEDNGVVDVSGYANLIRSIGGALVAPESDKLVNQIDIPADPSDNVIVAEVTDSQGNGIGGDNGGYTDISSALQAALAYEGADTPVTVSIVKNISTSFSVDIDKDIVIDLGGCLVYTGITGDYVFNVEEGSSLTITDTSECKNGTMLFTGNNEEGIMVYDSGELTLQGGMLMGIGGGIVNADQDSCGGVYIDGGEFKMTGGLIGNVCKSGGAVYVGDDGVFTMDGGKISGNVPFNPPNVYGGGVLIDGGVFTMNDGKICGNLTGAGSGVMVGGDDSGTFIMHGGEISDNTAFYLAGAGVMVQNGSIFHADGGKIIRNQAVCETNPGGGGGVYIAQEDDIVWNCLAAGTPVTLADGSRTAVENLKAGDEVRVFDHETGELSTAKLFVAEKIPSEPYTAFTLHFTNDIDVTAVSSHSFFNKEENKYVSIKSENAEDYVGHQFYNADEARWETLESVSYILEPVEAYSIETEKTLNAVANGMLSNGDAIYRVMINIFDFDDELKIDAEKKAADIAEYGLWDFEEAQYATRETYDALNLQYVKVAIGKGMITPEQLAGAGEYQEDHNKELVRSEDPAGEMPPIGMTQSVRMGTEDPLPLQSESDPLIVLGGDLQIMQNTSLTEGEDDAFIANVSNLFLWDDEDAPEIALGTKTTGASAFEGNGVLAPANMRVGITIGVNGYDDATDPAQIPSAGVFLDPAEEIDKAYFFSDSSDYYVSFDEDNSALMLSETADADKYDLWVGGTQVTAYNCGDVLLDGGSAAYDDTDHVLTLNNATIAGGLMDGLLNGVRSELEELTINLIGENVIGRESDMDVDWSGPEPGTAPAVLYGILGYDETTDEYGSIKFTGDSSSSLTIYDIYAGIKAGNVEFGSDFEGTLNVYDYGASLVPGCAINAVGEYESEAYVGGGEVTIKGGTLKLSSKHSEGIYADGKIIITGGTVEVKGSTYAIYSFSEAEDALCIGTAEKPATLENASFTGSETMTPEAITEASGNLAVSGPDGYYAFLVATSDTENDGYVKISFPEPEPEPEPGHHGRTFAAEEPEEEFVMVFEDVPEDAYYNDAVKWAAKNEITKGTAKTTFSPDKPVTRAQVITFLWRAAGSPVVDYAMSMSDIPEDAYYKEAVRWALSVGISNGTGVGTFSPDALCPRKQIITFIAKFAGEQNYDTATGFADVSETDYFAAAVKWAKDNGVAKGTTEDTFSPNIPCSRAQAVTFIWRWMVR